jgi:hypothetical protein
MSGELMVESEGGRVSSAANGPASAGDASNVETEPQQ